MRKLGPALIKAMRQYSLLLLLGRLENLERAKQTLVDAHHGPCIVEFTAVVGCTEQSHQLSFREEFISVFHDLMCTTYQVHVVLLQEP